jgi:hypothetical protein
MSDETKAIETIEAIAQDRYDWQQKYFALKAESEKLNAYVVLSIGELRTMIKRIEENNKTGFTMGLYKGRKRRNATGVFRADVKLDSNGKFQIASYQLANSNL